MSFWTGVFVGIAVFNGLQVPLALALYGKEITIDAAAVGGKLVLGLVALCLALAIHAGVL